MQNGNVAEELDALIVGSGFGGCWLLYHLRKLGYKVKIYDAAPTISGIWSWNCYPGARVDSDIPLYEFSLEEIWREWTWTERFPGRDELKAYFEFVDKKLEISKDCRFNARVTSAEFDKERDQWTITTEYGHIARARYFLPCTGFAAKRYVPPFKGLETFEGECHHTAVWPQKGIELRDKKVGVIGTGASGVQVIQEVGPIAKHLTVFQRTPNMALPMVQKKLDRQAQLAMKDRYPEIYKMRPTTFGGFDYDWVYHDLSTASPEEREALFEKLWATGGFHFWLANYQDILFKQDANDFCYEFWKKKVRARLDNPEMQEKLAPSKAPHAFGTKRPCLEQRYYDVYNQPNVDLINLGDDPILEVTPKGIQTASGFHELDVLVLATGFDSITGGLTQIDIKGIDGQTLKSKWANGTLTYLGMTTAGFPNLFFLYGPQGPTAFCNGPTCAELQGNWIINCIEHMRHEGKTRIDATAAAEKEWRQHVADLCNLTLFPGTSSWYMGTNIPGKPRESLNYTGGVPRYTRECREKADNGYEGFTLTAGAGAGSKSENVNGVVDGLEKLSVVAGQA